MKKIFLFSFVASLALFSCKKTDANANSQEVVVEQETMTTAPDMANSQNSLDWAGTYAAQLPCANCPGINVILVINADSTFTLTSDYIDSPTNKLTDNGTFVWYDNGSAIELTGKQSTGKYKVIENGLIQLDSNGNEITSDMKELYVFKKQ